MLIDSLLPRIALANYWEAYPESGDSLDFHTYTYFEFMSSSPSDKANEIDPVLALPFLEDLS